MWVIISKKLSFIFSWSRIVFIQWNLTMQLQKMCFSYGLELDLILWLCIKRYKTLIYILNTFFPIFVTFFSWVVRSILNTVDLNQILFFVPDFLIKRRYHDVQTQRKYNINKSFYFLSLNQTINNDTSKKTRFDNRVVFIKVEQLLFSEDTASI